MHIQYSRGFTLLELVIVIAILGLLLSTVVSSFSIFRQNGILNTETQNTITLINKARLSAMSSKGDMEYGVHLTATGITLFEGATYSAGVSTNEVHTFDPALTLSTISINGGGSDVVFQQITGKTSQDATLKFTVVANATASSTMIIRPSGVATIY